MFRSLSFDLALDSAQVPSTKIGKKYFGQLLGHYLGKLDQHGPCQNEAQFFFLALRQTTPNDIPLLFYASIQRSMYQMSQKCKIEMSLDVSNWFFLNWLFSWGFDQ